MTALFASPLTWMIFGAAAQLALASWVRSPRTYLWAGAPLVMVICLLAAIPTARSGSPYAYQIAMGFGLLLSAGVIASAVPAAMNGGIVLAITTTYWISMLVAGERTPWGVFPLLPAAFVAVVPTAVLLAITATGLRPARALRFLLYLWALFALVVVGATRFPYSDFAALERSGRGWIVILAAAYLGAHIAMLVHNALSLLILIPFTGENQTFNQRLKEVEKYAGRLIASYSPAPVGRRTAVLVVVGQGGFVWLLSLWRPEGAWLAVHSCLSLSLIAAVFFSRPAEPEGPVRLPTGGDLKREERLRRALGRKARADEAP